MSIVVLSYGFLDHGVIEIGAVAARAVLSLLVHAEQSFTVSSTFLSISGHEKISLSRCFVRDIPRCASS